MKYYENETDPGAHLPLNFGLIDKLDDESSAVDFSNAIYAWLDNIPQKIWANWVIGNHDQHRVADRFGPEMVDAMNMLVLLLPGTAFTYMGEEIGMQDARIRWNQTVDPIGLDVGRGGYRELSRDPERSPFQWNAYANSGFTKAANTWLPVNPNYWTLNRAAQKEQNRSHYAVYKRLTALRKTSTFLRGSFEGHVLSEWVFAFSRSLLGAETYLVVMNVGSEYENVVLYGLPTVKERYLVVYTSSVNSQYSQGYTLDTNGFKMRPKSALVLTTALNETISSTALSFPTFPTKMSLTAITFFWANRCGIFRA